MRFASGASCARTGLRAAALLEVAHDRPPRRRGRRDRSGDLRGDHLGLARTLEAGRSADPEVLALHFHEAGRFDEAARPLAAAAGQAAAALAFDHAAELYGARHRARRAPAAGSARSDRAPRRRAGRRRTPGRSRAALPGGGRAAPPRRRSISAAAPRSSSS